jgi:hypothetical protein
MTESEVALCDRLRDWAERLGFEVYPEVAGWDLVLVASRPIELGRNGQEVAAGEQVGVHAKLRANCDVLAQAVPGGLTYGPTWPMVAVPVAGGSFRYISRLLGIGVIEAPPAAKPYLTKGDPRITEDPRRSTLAPLHLPPVASRVIVAGAPSPRVLSPWRVKALRFLAFARAAAETRFRASDVKTHGLSISWVERWGVPVDWATENRRGKPVRVRVYQLTDNAERLPDWGYLDVARELLEADRGA